MKSRDLLVHCIYIPPSLVKDSLQPLSNVLEFVERYKATTLIVGDLNFPDIDWSLGIVKSNSNLKGLHQCFLSLLLIHIWGNTLDLLITNNKDRLTKVEVVKPSLSDHFRIKVELNSWVLCQAENAKIVKLFDRADVESFSNCLDSSLEKIKNAICESQKINQV